MKKEESMSVALMMDMGSMALLGYKYMMCHPEVKKNMKNSLKCATKKLYQKLDEMD